MMAAGAVQGDAAGGEGTVRRLITDEEMVGPIGFAMTTLPRTLLRSWGIDPDGPLRTWESLEDHGHWIEGRPAAREATNAQ